MVTDDARPIFSPEDFPQLLSTMKTEGNANNHDRFLASAGAPETDSGTTIMPITHTTSGSTRGSAVPWESALMRSRPKSPDGIDADDDVWNSHTADVMETEVESEDEDSVKGDFDPNTEMGDLEFSDDENDDVDIPLKYLPEPVQTSGPIRGYRSTVGNGMMHASAKQRFACPKMADVKQHATDDNSIMVSVDYAVGSNINSAEETREMTVALDSGAVDHVLATDDLPSSAEICELTGSRVGKSFVAANGQAMQTFGECTLECEDGSGKSIASFAVTEVSRPLQSVSRICDQDYEVLFTKTEAKIRDPRTGRFVATYPRRGGLYTRTVKIRAGKRPDTAARPKAPFTRQSAKR